MKPYAICYLLFVLLTIEACNSPEEKKIIVEEQSLLYIASRGKGFDIYQNTIEGQAERRLTNGKGWEWSPQFIYTSGNMVFNQQDTSGNFSMGAMKLSGEDIEFDDGDLPDLKLAPNGQKVAFSRKDDAGTHIKIASFPNTGDSIQITQGDAYHGRMVWSFNGKKLAFISDKSGSNEVYIYDLTTKKTIQATSNNEREKYLSWSLDGQLATTIEGLGGNNDIFLINTSTLEITQLTDTPLVNESEISWSPKGDYMAYHAKVDEKDDIFLIKLSDNSVSKVTNGNGYHGEPTWAFTAKAQ